MRDTQQGRLHRRHFSRWVLLLSSWCAAGGSCQTAPPRSSIPLAALCGRPAHGRDASGVLVVALPRVGWVVVLKRCLLLPAALLPPPLLSAACCCRCCTVATAAAASAAACCLLPLPRDADLAWPPVGLALHGGPAPICQPVGRGRAEAGPQVGSWNPTLWNLTVCPDSTHIMFVDIDQ